ncbi:hypothetical protein ACSBPQ_05915 [Stenotrophomonas sp. JC08]|uniref:hypothetical protein n=1 Tax=Stenotrophomonas sp. JC08 TaxID=3445779 RepID=UPI003FA1CD8E
MNRVLIHRRAQQLLPAAIETSGLLQFGLSPVQAGEMVLDCLFGTVARGVVVLRLAADALPGIRRQGLAFFAQARVARGGLAGAAPVRYAQWRQLRLGPNVPSSGWTGTAYVVASRDGRAWLAVLPVERLVICGWMGRQRAKLRSVAASTGRAMRDVTGSRCAAMAGIAHDHDHWPARRPVASG